MWRIGEIGTGRRDRSGLGRRRGIRGGRGVWGSAGLGSLLGMCSYSSTVTISQSHVYCT